MAVNHSFRGRKARLVGAPILLSLLFAGCAVSRQAPRTIPSEPGPVVAAEAVEAPVSAGPLDAVDGAGSDLSLFPETLVAGTTAAPSPRSGVEAPSEGVEPLADSGIAPMADLRDPPDAIHLAEARLSMIRPPAPEPTFDIPIEINDRVRHYIDQFTRPYGRAGFEAALARSGRHMQMFRRIFAEEGVPRDMVYMAHVESAYKTTAYSRARARGIFQFIAGTARRYGLRVDHWVDERSDPEMSAKAAARYLKDLRREFGNWYLALAAYNAGEGKIRSGLRRSGKKDFWGLARTRYIRRETKNHIPAVIAAAVISKDPEKYGIRYRPDPPVTYDSIEVVGAADLRVLARCAGTDTETLAGLNPAIRRHQTPPTGTTQVRVPAGTGSLALAALDRIPAGERVLYARHQVRRGETLSTLARRYGVSVQSIQGANQMGRRTMIHEGKTLKIPTASAGTFAAGDPVGNRGDVVVHRVRRGDTLYGVARQFDTTPASIAAVNDISLHALLRIGQKLRVVHGVRSPSEARRMVHAVAAADDSTLIHTVRHGDTLWHIASLYRTSVNMLCSLNKISPQSILRPGVKLTVGYR